ncbi:MAG: arylesterase [Gammaproteobacteria bacterium]|nr:arylesterase [Gammaproteobacteria bacterium]
MAPTAKSTAARVVLALCCLLAATGCGEGVPRLAPLGEEEVVVAFGDSLFGTGATAAESYPAVLERLIGRTVVKAGVPGEVTEAGLARLESIIDEHEPKLMIVCLGGNDMLRKLNAAATKSNLRAIVTAIQARGIGVVLVGVPTPALFTGTAPFYEEIAEELGIPYEGEIIDDVLSQADQKSDPIHPNAQGYRRIAEAIAALLKKTGAL